MIIFINIYIVVHTINIHCSLVLLYHKKKLNINFTEAN